MKKILLVVICLTFTLPILSQDMKDVKEQSSETSTYYFIRHAEKDRSDKTNKNPNLTQKGLFRAVKWSTVLENISFDAVYSTDYNRTKQTAQPTAEKNALELTIYNPRNIDGKNFLDKTRGKTVLVVGHSNTTPMFVNAVIGSKKYPQIDDSNNSNLYIVTVSSSGEVVDTLIVIN